MKQLIACALVLIPCILTLSVSGLVLAADDLKSNDTKNKTYNSAMREDCIFMGWQFFTLETIELTRHTS